MRLSFINAHLWRLFLCVALFGAAFFPTSGQQVQVAYPALDRHWGYAQADIDLDGLLDLVTLGRSGLAWCSYGNAEAELHPIDAGCYFGNQVTVGDFNGDGLPDVATSSKHLTQSTDLRAIIVHFQTEQGWNSVTVETFAEDDIGDLASGDLTGDGIDDLVFALPLSQTLWMRAGNVLGGFATPQLLSDTYFRNVLVGHFNDDTRMDVRAHAANHAWGSILSEGATDFFENGLFTSETKAASGDLNGDGLDDMAWGSEDESTFFYALTLPTGGVESPVALPAGNENLENYHADFIQILDKDGDGDLDIFAFWFDHAYSEFIGWQENWWGYAWWVNEDGAFTEESCYRYDAHDGDNDVEVYMHYWLEAGNGQPLRSIARNTYTRLRINAPAEDMCDPFGRTGQTLTEYTQVDLWTGLHPLKNADGSAARLVIPEHDHYRWMSFDMSAFPSNAEQQATFSPVELINPGYGDGFIEWPWKIDAVAIDVDGDGNEELATFIRTLDADMLSAHHINILDPALEEPLHTLHASGLEYSYFGIYGAYLPGNGVENIIITGDVNLDGLPDVIAGSGARGTVLIFQNENGEGFAPAIPVQTDADLSDLQLGDLDANGLPDVVFRTEESGTVQLGYFPQLAPGLFGEAQYFENTWEEDARLISALDLSGDGYSDLTLLHTSTPTVRVFPGPLVSPSLPSPVVTSLPMETVTAWDTEQLAGDDRPELALAWDTGELLLTRFEDDGSVQVEAEIPLLEGAPLDMNAIAFGTFTHPTVPELVVYGHTNYGTHGLYQRVLLHVPLPEVPGCTLPDAANFDPLASQNDGSCCYGASGCTHPNADNYDPTALCDDASCVFTLTGQVFLDLNENGTLDGTEAPLPNVLVHFPMQAEGVLTDPSGGFEITGLPEGATTVSVGMLSVDPGFTAPYSTSHLTGTDPTPLLIPLEISTVEPEIQSHLLLTGQGLICNVQSTLIAAAQNTYFAPADITIAVAFDTLQFAPDYLTTPDSIAGGSAYFSFADVPPGVEVSAQIQLQAPDFTFLGEVFSFTSEVTGSWPNGQVSTSTNALGVELGCAYDPNDKQPQHPEYTPQQYAHIEAPLHYHIRFQNTGNAPAEHVVVQDTIAPYLDLHQLQVLGASHAVETHIDFTTRVVSFEFEGIQLPDSTCCEPESHGFVNFQIPALPSAPNWELVENTALIYFDLNPAVVTNTTASTLYRCEQDALLANATLNLCEHEILEASAEAPFVDTYTWTLDGVEVHQGSALALEDLTAGEHLLALEAANPYCTRNRSFDVHVFETPELLVFTPDTALCAGQPLLLDAASSHGTPSWSGSPSGAGAQVLQMPTESQTYSAYVSNPGCSVSAQVSVEVWPLPEFDWDEDYHLCNGTSLTLHAPEENTQWSDGTTGPLWSAIPEEDFTLSATATDTLGCSSSATAEITIYPDLDIDAGPDQALCTGEYYIIQPEGATHFDFNPGPEHVTFLVAYPEETTTYIVTSNNDFGCTDTDSITIFVSDPIPTQPPSSLTMCPEWPLEIDLTSYVDLDQFSVAWEDGSTDLVYTLEEYQAQVEFTVQAHTGCTQDFTIDIQQQMLPPLELDDVTACVGDEVTIDPGTGVQWWFENGPQGTVEPWTFSVEQDTEVIVAVSWGGGSGCTRSDTLEVIGQPLLEWSLDSPETMCPGTPFQLALDPDLTYDFWPEPAWSDDTGVWFTYEVPVTQTVMLNEPGICAEDLEVLIPIATLPTLTLTAPTPPICAGDSVAIVATSDAQLLWSDGTVGPEWSAELDTSMALSVTADPDGMCPVWDTLWLEVSPLPELELAGPSGLCMGDSTELTAIGQGNIVWMDGPTSDAWWVWPETSHTYTATAELDGCTTTQTLTLEVWPLPAYTLTQAGNVLEITGTEGDIQWLLEGTPIAGATSSTHQVEVSGNYSALLTSEEGCEALTSPVWVNYTHIEQHLGVPLQVYPNPATDIMHVVLPGSTTNTLELVDGSGRVVWSKPGLNPGLHAIDISPVASGLYTLRWGDALASVRVVIR